MQPFPRFPAGTAFTPPLGVLISGQVSQLKLATVVTALNAFERRNRQRQIRVANSIFRATGLRSITLSWGLFRSSARWLT
jgi:hypothetical protein